MNQPPPDSDSNEPSTPNSGIRQSSETSKLDGGQQGIQGNDNTQIQIIKKLSDNIIVVNLVVNFFSGNMLPWRQESAVSGDKQEERDRKNFLDKVKNSWIDDVLKKSLQDEVLIELGLQQRPDAVDTPANWTWETPEQVRQTLPSGTRVIDKFESLGFDCSLLILGDPGSGKTITLLQLARELIEPAKEDVRLPMPVVLNLSSWKRQRQTLNKWLIEELNNEYDVPREIGERWISKDKLLLLLDGLDEIREDIRIDCVEALNRFRKKHKHTNIVVCSRIREYEDLNRRLRFSAAIRLLPLTQEDIHNYLDNLDSQKLATVREALRKNTDLRKLAESPLWLNIIILVYKSLPDVTLAPKETTLSPNPITVGFNFLKGLINLFPQRSSDELTPEPRQALANQQELRQRLFNAYIERMFLRRRTKKNDTEHEKEKAKAKHWLIWLAKRMEENSQTVFSIEDMQPSWFQTDYQRRIYHFAVMLIVRSLSGLSGGLIASLFNYSPQPINSSLLYMCMGAVAGLISGVITELFTQFNFGVINKWKHRIYVIDFSSIFGRRFRKISDIFTRHNSEVVSQLLTDLSSEVEALNLKLSFGLILIFELFICIASLYLTSSLFSETTITPILETPLFLFIVLFISSRTDIENIKPTDSRVLSFSEAKNKFIIGMVCGMFSGIILLIIGMIITFITNQSFTINNVWFNNFLDQTAKLLYTERFNLKNIIKIFFGLQMLGLFVGLWVGLVLGVEKKDFVEKDKKIPNEGIWNSVINSLNLITIGGLIGAFISVVVWILAHIYPDIIWWVHYGNDPFADGVVFALVVGSIIGLLNGLVGGDNSGLVCIKHFVLRVILHRSDNIPWNYARFLDYATERILLRKVNGSYIFIHRLILEHFALMPDADQSASE
ncbi:NACHT domain-containing protein [aff. Roholtiella sp. LEGE 12411]|uniref:NACHT domain-containing protein n=1 Tax=aff. Roholtiella sp. LEGE 12411 TaxID=1828822 RepID=UPI0018812779|nr:NACHT domain-containing protein [aff. Roholtiella sp. LEGE 12411]MBE9036214.1 NACHT domain-containing protein [aff. Roholtiella sp. LEGE 12411]